jgi:GNAT superfamily N-acetyltransferase
MSLEIRAALAADEQRWFILWQGYLDFYQTKLSIEQSALAWQRILDPEFNMECAVAVDEGVIVGFTTYNLQNSTWSEGGHCYLEDLFVDPAVRGKGVGRALIDHVKSYAIENNCSRLYWNTDEDNATARKLYDTYTLESGKRQYRIPLS